MPRPVLRFAPSPNGYLHLGHAYSALVSHRTARRLGGRFLLRIEDIDAGRCRPEFEAAIYEDLAWLGLDWEESVRRQSDHFDAYRRAARRLEERGLLYPCFASRAEVAATVARREAQAGSWPRDPDGAPLYPGLHRNLPDAERARLAAEGGPFALRLDMEKAAALAGPLSWTEIADDGAGICIPADPAMWGDIVVMRKDVPASYHLAVVVDDALQGITHVTRGRDLYWQTSIHRLLQELQGLPAPVYAHHRLILDRDGHKLSKSRGDTALRALRESGATPDDIRRMVGLGRET
jgi:glutamyl-Q tRNA(Asp) synthetase